jgi:hypothetical protein
VTWSSGGTYSSRSCADYGHRYSSSLPARFAAMAPLRAAASRALRRTRLASRTARQQGSRSDRDRPRGAPGRDRRTCPAASPAYLDQVETRATAAGRPPRVIGALLVERELAGRVVGRRARPRVPRCAGRGHAAVYGFARFGS